MAIKNSGSGPDTPEEPDSLSATGMFLRAFGEEPKADPKPADPLAGMPAAASAHPEVNRPTPPPAGAGEFTQMFQRVESRQPSSSSSGEIPLRPPAPPAAQIPPQPPVQHAPDRSPGEFTKVFVSGQPTTSTPLKNVDENTRSTHLPPMSPSRAKGFSSPGVSGSASGEGSFTQVFKTAAATTSFPPAPARPPAAPPAPAPKPSWNNDPIFRNPPGASPEEPNSPSVTSILASLASPGNSSPARGTDTPAYRPDPTPHTPPFMPRESTEASAGSVTQMIQRLAQTPAEPPPPAPPIVAPPPVSAGPGEFTRMISRSELTSPPAEPPPAPQAAAPAPFAYPPLPPMPAFTPPAPPQLAHPAAPPMPAFAPSAAAPAPAPRFTPPASPAVPAIPIPAAPKPPALAAPALAPPKTKLEAMVPILLVINTFLLLVLLIVVIFLIKGR
jgi:hypothetical protein